MNISHNNFIISNIELNSSEAKKNFQEILQKDKLGQTINTTKITSAFLDEIINTLRNYTPKTASTISTGSSQTIITIDKIKKYLGVEPSDVLEKDGKTLIAFSLKNIEFIGNFDTTNNTITALYFRKILTNKNPTFIKNIQLVLDDIHKTEDEQFTVNPLNYIKDKNPEIYIYYQQFI